MKVPTDSGYLEINKRSRHGKFIQGYLSTGAFSGSSTLSAAIQMGNEIKTKFPSISAHDCGKLVGHVFIHKPHDQFLNAITGVIKPRGERI